MRADSPLRIDHWIGNVAVPSIATDTVHDPGRLAELVGVISRGGPDEVDRAVRSAAEAFPVWRATPVETRAALLMRAADLLEAEAAAVVTLMARESGMLVTTNTAEIAMAANIVRDNAEAGADFLAPQAWDDAESWVGVEKRPLGVVAAIVPWNAPVILAMRKVSPALVCGNTVVVKPAPTAPIGLSILLAKIAGLFPPGVINVVHGGAEVGRALAVHPLVAKVSFTGGGAVARSIMKDAAIGLKGVQFELGGNDPAIIHADADLDMAIPRIVGGAFRRSGQFCFAVKRVYAPTELYREVVDRIRAEVDKFRVGHPLEPGVTLGPINNEVLFRSLQDLLKRVRASGAKVEELGAWISPKTEADGWYMRPVLVSDIEPTAELVLVEQFGPILPVVRYDDVATVIDDVNAGELGLGSSIWTRNTDWAVEIARQLEVGMTFVNNAGTSRLGQKNIPFGGVKQSGIGRESSPIGLREYIDYHAINFHR